MQKPAKIRNGEEKESRTWRREGPTVSEDGRRLEEWGESLAETERCNQDDRKQ
jgi:hypothetical protein